MKTYITNVAQRIYPVSIIFQVLKTSKMARRSSCLLETTYKMIPMTFLPVSIRYLLPYIYTSYEYHMKRYLNEIPTAILSNRACEFSIITTIFIYKVIYVCLTYKHPIPSLPLSDHHVVIDELCSYSHIIRQLEKGYNDRRFESINLLYKFFKCQTIRQHKHSL